MPGLRNHEPLVIEEFNGWWDRGDDESAPSDHFIQADNVQYFNSGFETRDALDKYQTGTQLTDIVRVYNYVMQNGQSLLILNTSGEIYHVIGPSTVHGPILTIAAMEDFGFVAINGRAYITPFKSYVNTLGVNYELGLQNEFVYVYKGDGTAARKAAGPAPSNTSKLPFLAYNAKNDGQVTQGLHVIAVAFNAGILGIEVFPVVDAPGDKQIELHNIPIGPVGTTSRTIVMTRKIPYESWVPDQTSYTYYTVETIADNTTQNKKINKTDAQLTSTYVPGVTAAPAPAALLVQQVDTDPPGYCDFGFHLVGVVYETDTGYLTAPGPEHFGGQTYVDTRKAIKISNIPISPNPYVTKRHLVSTKWIPEYNGDQLGYQFFFIPDGNIDDNTTTEKTVSYYDSDLLDDASHLTDNFAEIPAGVNLNTYHSRMVVVGEYGTTESLEGIQAPQVDNRSVARVSFPGEPEAISKIDGIIIAPLDGNPLTNVQEFRDVLYLFKKTRTIAYSDNNDEPATWSEEVIDQGVGSPVHGIATVLDSGGVNVDYLLVADWSGLMLFNGVYARPELSWKIEDYWMSVVRNDFRYIQVANDSLSKKIWLTLPTPNRYHMLHADYGNGLDAKNIRWARWVFDAKISSICLIETTKLIIGAISE